MVNIFTDNAHDKDERTKICKKYNNIIKIIVIEGKARLAAEAKSLTDEIENELTKAFQYGINNIDKVIAEEQNNYSGIDVNDYLTNGIDFILDDEKIKAMKLFLTYLKEIEI